MNKEEQEKICRAIAVTGMWGHGWISGALFDRFEHEGVEVECPWREVYNEVWKDAQRKSVGVLEDETRLRDYLRRGYWLTNYNEDGCSLFNPPPINGLCIYVSKPLSDKMKLEQDRAKEFASKSTAEFFEMIAASQRASFPSPKSK